MARAAPGTQGGVTKLASGYLNYGRPVADYRADAFDGLIKTGLLALGQSDPIGQQQVCVTHIGQVRYAAIRNGQRNRQNGNGGR